MSMNKTLNIFIAFIAIFIIAFFAIGFTSQVQAPTNATALAQYNNLSNTTSIASDGVNGVLLLLIMGMILTAIIGAFAMKRR